VSNELPTENVVYSYTRKQAIEDGVLIELRDDHEFNKMLIYLGLSLPSVVVTAGVYAAAVEPSGRPLPPEVTRDKRMRDLLVTMRVRINLKIEECKKNGEEPPSMVDFSVMVDEGTDTRKVDMWVMVGPGDDASPVMTIMLKGED